MGAIEEHINLLKQGGASEEQINEHKRKSINILRQGGFDDDQIAKELGIYRTQKLKEEDDVMNPIRNYWKERINVIRNKANKVKTWAVGEESQIYDYFREGFGQSTTNLMLQYHTKGEQGYDWRKAFGNQLTDDGAIERLVRSIGTIVGDTPTGLIGAAPYLLTRQFTKAAFAGGFVNDSIKETYFQSLKSGKVTGFKQWWDLFVDHGVGEGLKGGAMLAGTIAGPAALHKIGLSKNFMTTLAGTYLGMTGMGTAIESVEKGKLTLPSKQQLQDNLLLVGTLGIGAKATQMAVNRMVNTKESLSDVVQDVLKDPVSGQEAASININVFNKTLTENATTKIKKLVDEFKVLKDIENGKGPKKEDLEKQKQELEEESFRANTIETFRDIENRSRDIDNQIEEINLRETDVPDNQVRVSRRQNEIREELREFGEKIGSNDAEVVPPRNYEDEDMKAMSEFYKPEKVKIEKEADGVFNKLDKFMFDRIDSIFPVKKIEKLAEKEGAEKNFVYEQITNLAGVVGKAMSAINGSGTKSFFDADKITGKSLYEILKPLEYKNGRSKYDEFNIYKISKRVIELEGRGIVTGMPIERARNIVTKYGDEYENISKEYDEFTQRILDYMEDAGVITKKLKESIISANKDFVPFYKLFDPKFKGNKSQGGMPIKQIVGVERIQKKVRDLEEKINTETDEVVKNQLQKQYNATKKEYLEKVSVIDPIEMTMKNTMQMIMLAERNVAMVDFIKTIESAKGKNPDAFKFIEKVKPAIQETTATRKEIETAFPQLKNLSDDQINNLSIFRAKPKDLTNTQISIMRNGKREIWDLGSEVLVQAIKRDKQFNKLYGLIDVDGAVFKTAEIVTQVKRFGITVHPKFTLANFLAQELTMPFISKTTYIPVVDGLKGIVWQVKNKKIEREFVESGQAQSTFVDADRQLFSANKMREQIEKRDYIHTLDSKSPISSLLYPFEVMKRAGARVGRLAQRPTVLTEQAPRIVASKQLKNKLLKDNQNLPVNQRLTKRQIDTLSTYEGRDIIDFSRRGARMEAASRTNAFLNAGIQGLYKLARTATNPKQITRFAMTGFFGMTVPTIINWYANRDSETYKNGTSDWEKLNFWVFVVNEEKGQYFTVRKPWELGWLFATLPEKMLNYAYKTDKDYVNKMEKTWFEGAWSYFSNFIPVTDMFMPYFEEGFNRNMYTKRPIVSRSNENKLAEFQETPYTSEVAKKIGDGIRGIGNFIGIEGRNYGSPVIIDHYINAYTATLGRDVIAGLDAIIKKFDKDAKDYIKPWSDDTFDKLTKAPVANYFFRRTKLSAEPISKYWQNYKKIRKYQGQVTELIEKGQIQKAKEIVGDFEVGLVQVMNKHTEKMQEKYNIYTLLQTREVGKSDFTPQQIDNLLDTTLNAILNHAKQVNELVANYEKNFKDLKK